MVRNRDLFRLWRIQYRTNVAEVKTALVWAHRMSDALSVVEQYASSSDPLRFASAVLAIHELRTPDTDTEDFATVLWVGGDPA